MSSTTASLFHLFRLAEFGFYERWIRVECFSKKVSFDQFLEKNDHLLDCKSPNENESDIPTMLPNVSNNAEFHIFPAFEAGHFSNTIVGFLAVWFSLLKENSLPGISTISTASFANLLSVHWIKMVETTAMFKQNQGLLKIFKITRFFLWENFNIILDSNDSSMRDLDGRRGERKECQDLNKVKGPRWFCLS